MKDFKEILQVVALMAILVSLALIFAAPLIWLSATQEAAAFNRMTAGPKVTTWDAVWLDLRVEAQR
jgi:hypothetical protein